MKPRIFIFSAVKRPKFLSAMAKSVGPVLALLGLFATGSAMARDYVTVQRHDFEGVYNANADLGPEWHVLKSDGARVQMEGDGRATLYTDPNTVPGNISIAGTRRFPILANVPLVFSGRLTAYVEQSAIYGNHQPRGLAQVHNRNNAIEFVTAYPTPSSVACRTVKDGIAQETIVSIGHDVYQFTTYQIIATSTRVDFYIDGKRVARHTANIPVVPLNLHLSTSDGGANSIPMSIDWVSFGRLVD